MSYFARIARNGGSERNARSFRVPEFTDAPEFATILVCVLECEKFRLLLTHHCNDDSPFQSAD